MIATRFLRPQICREYSESVRVKGSGFILALGNELEKEFRTRNCVMLKANDIKENASWLNHVAGRNQ